MFQFGGKDSKRHFTVVMGDKEHGLYVSSNPSSAAKKVVTKLCAANKSKKVEFSIREITQGSKKKTYGPYVGHIEKLKDPIKLEGRVIKYKSIVKLSDKSGMKKGGMKKMKKESYNQNFYLTHMKGGEWETTPPTIEFIYHNPVEVLKIIIDEHKMDSIYMNIFGENIKEARTKADYAEREYGGNPFINAAKNRIDEVKKYFDLNFKETKPSPNNKEKEKENILLKFKSAPPTINNIFNLCYDKSDFDKIEELFKTFTILADNHKENNDYINEFYKIIINVQKNIKFLWETQQGSNILNIIEHFINLIKKHFDDNYPFIKKFLKNEEEKKIKEEKEKENEKRKKENEKRREQEAQKQKLLNQKTQEKEKLKKQKNELEQILQNINKWNITPPTIDEIDNLCSPPENSDNSNNIKKLKQDILKKIIDEHQMDLNYMTKLKKNIEELRGKINQFMEHRTTKFFADKSENIYSIIYYLNQKFKINNSSQIQNNPSQIQNNPSQIQNNPSKNIFKYYEPYYELEFIGNKNELDKLTDEILTQRLKVKKEKITRNDSKINVTVDSMFFNANNKNFINQYYNDIIQDIINNFKEFNIEIYFKNIYTINNSNNKFIDEKKIK
jgi:hypothetical protein